MKVPAFVIVFLKRLKTKNPKFFNILRNVSLGIGALSLLISYIENQGIDLPPVFDIISDLSVKIGAATAIIMAQLTVDDQSKIDS